MGVPNAPGVPSLLLGTLQDLTEFLTQDSFSYFGGNFGPQWGIFQGGAPVVTADTVISFEYKHEWAVADFPVERGSFESYDKVAQPFDARVRLVAGGSESNRQALLNSVAAIAGTLQLYDVVTPEAVYSPANIKHYDYRRTATNGVGMITVDIWLTEIRQASVGGMDNTAAASGADQQNLGTVTVGDAPPNLGAVPSFANTTAVNYQISQGGGTTGFGGYPVQLK